jgi:hypothetical protein
VQDYTIKVAGPPERSDEMDPRTLAPVPDTIRLLIEHGQRTGELRTFPSGAEVSGLIVNLLLLRSINRPEEPAEVTAELLQTVMFGMLRPEMLVCADGNARPFRATH